MTDSEKIHAMGEAASELAEAKRTLACVKTRAERERRELQAWVDLLGTAIDPEAPKADKLPTEESYPSYEQLSGLCKSASATRQRIRELEERFRSWGVIDR